MKVLSFEVSGLFGKQPVISLQFNDDMNILTGRNGAGKTSVMKLMWYIISGNLEYALSEINFSKATLVTDEYSCTVFKINRNTCKVELSTSDGQVRLFEDLHDDDGDVFRNAEDGANVELLEIGSSVFLPTFRRIEGGFSLRPNRGPFPRMGRNKNEVEDGLLALSKKISNGDHTFVTSISSTDIVEILLRKYANLSQTSNDYQQSTSLEIIERIRAYEDSAEVTAPNRASEVLSEVKKKVENIEKMRSDIMSPMEELRIVVEKLFKHVGIRIDSRVSFGDAASAVHSDELSAGEKQMLSFLCYNAFYSNSVIFIDEPELSLHVDWQRQLFTILNRQNSTNQFIIATHSPFIYSKYPSKELSLDSDRGDSEQEE
ncbi:ATP-binding protein [Pseudomonas putida]|uniref:AAA family ATPase n=1 Tax=Pseudomonas putida TaxID=303 RepID=UPI0006B5D765|nr:ATP-binding protein [Pseudomonas putida]USX38366.1 ATP-binding protein [Pseudomonas putida]